MVKLRARGRTSSDLVSALHLPGLADRRELPEWVLWSIVVLTAASMAIINVASVWTMRLLVEWKFSTMQAFIASGGIWLGVVTLVGICCGFALAATLIIHLICRDAGGSGAPENKGWLNGNDLPNYFTWKSLFVRASAVILGNCAGYPVGREGPSVTMGSNLAFLITKALAERRLKKNVDIDTVGAGPVPARVYDLEGLQRVQRMAGAVGGACAMTMIFDAPIGGVLYMFEEISVDSWPLELTFRAFVGTQICKLISAALLGIFGKDIKQYVLYDETPSLKNWTMWDVPVMILLAGMLGPFSAFHTRAALQVGKIRAEVHAKISTQRMAPKMIEAVLFATICCLCYALVSLLADCNTKYQDMPFVAKYYVQYNCEENAYNPVASLLLTTSEGAVKRLFSRDNTGAIKMYNTFLAFLTYTTMNICLTGIPVPSGNFTGTMLIGAFVGRMFGSLVQPLAEWMMVNLKMGHVAFASPGVYAMVGSAAMLSGFKQIALGSVVFILEAANDLSLSAPLMMSVSISLMLNRRLLKHGFDEEQIKRKKVPFLPPDPPAELAQMAAEKLCDNLPDCAVLQPTASVRKVQQVVNEYQTIIHFPVVDEEGTCIGYTTRARLEAALQAIQDEQGAVPSTPSMRSRSRSSGLGGFKYSRRRMTLEEHALNELVDSAFHNRTATLDTLPVERLVDPVTFMVPMDVPCSRFYLLFAKVGATVISVVTETGQFYGIISRVNLIQKFREADEGKETDDDEDGHRSASSDD